MATKKVSTPKERIICDSRFSQQSFEEWKAGLDEDDREFLEDGGDGSLYEAYYESLRTWFEDEECNLKHELDLPVIALADLGFWDGRRTGAKKCGYNVNSILSLCGCDDAVFYCDRHNVKGKLFHHDGTHYTTYRIANSEEVAERIMERAVNGILTEEYFMRNTKSLRPYVAKVYGW